MKELTASAFDDSCRLRKHGISRSETLDVVPDLVASSVRVDGCNTGFLVGQGFWEASDAPIVGLQACGNDESIVGQRPPGGGCERR